MLAQLLCQIKLAVFVTLPKLGTDASAVCLCAAFVFLSLLEECLDCLSLFMAQVMVYTSVCKVLLQNVIE